MGTRNARGLDGRKGWGRNGLIGICAFALVAVLSAALVWANDASGASLQITSGSPPVSQPVVGVGTADTANFVVNLTGGDSSQENTKPGIATEVYTFDAGSGGVISGISPVPGLVMQIASGGQTATATGVAPSSFDVSATVTYAKGGNETVTCTGVVTYNDGSTVNSSPSGSDSLIAVQVDSLALADSPTSVSIGQTLTRKDFTITTTPSGHGNDQDQNKNYIVSFSPASFAVAIGDNNVTASTGPSSQPTSSATFDVIGAAETATWGGVTYEDKPNGNLTVAFTAEVQGVDGSYTVTGPDVSGGNTSGPLTADTPFAGSVVVHDPGTVGTSDVVLTVTRDTQGASGSGGSAGASAAAVVPQQAVQAGAAVVGAAAAAAPVVAQNSSVQVIPNAAQWLSVSAPLGGYTPSVVQALAQPLGTGSGFFFLDLDWWWTDKPGASLKVDNLSATFVIKNFSQRKEDIYTECKNTIVNGGPNSKLAIKNSPGLDSGVMLGNSSCFAGLPGSYWGLKSITNEGILYLPQIPGPPPSWDGNWTAAGNFGVGPNGSDAIDVEYKWN